MSGAFATLRIAAERATASVKVAGAPSTAAALASAFSIAATASNHGRASGQSFSTRSMRPPATCTRKSSHTQPHTVQATSSTTDAAVPALMSLRRERLPGDRFLDLLDEVRRLAAGRQLLGLGLGLAS